MKKRTLFTYVLAPALGLGLGLLGGVGTVSAQGFGSGMMSRKIEAPDELASRHNEIFQREATLLGVSVDDVKSAWATGKSLQTLAKEKGISEDALRIKIEAERRAQVLSELQTLVSKGVITQGQSDARMKFIGSLPKGGKGGMGKHGHHGRFGF